MFPLLFLSASGWTNGHYRNNATYTIVEWRMAESKADLYFTEAGEKQIFYGKRVAFIIILTTLSETEMEGKINSETFRDPVDLYYVLIIAFKSITLDKVGIQLCVEIKHRNKPKKYKVWIKTERISFLKILSDYFKLAKAAQM